MGLDIRIPLGLIFLIIGGIMALFGIFTHGDAALYEKSLGVDLNLTWGCLMLSSEPSCSSSASARNGRMTR